MTAQPIEVWSRTYCQANHWVPVHGCTWCPNERALRNLAMARHPAGSKRHLEPVKWEQEREAAYNGARALGKLLARLAFLALLLIAYAAATPFWLTAICGLCAFFLIPAILPTKEPSRVP